MYRHLFCFSILRLIHNSDGNYITKETNDDEAYNIV